MFLHSWRKICEENRFHSHVEKKISPFVTHHCRRKGKRDKSFGQIWWSTMWPNTFWIRIRISIWSYKKLSILYLLKAAKSQKVGPFFKNKITKLLFWRLDLNVGEQWFGKKNRMEEKWDFAIFKVEKNLKGSLDSIPSPSLSVKIQIMGRKVCLRCKGKPLLGIVNKLLKTKSLLTSPSNVLPYYLK